MGKNIQRVQDMLDGNYKHKIQSGYIGEKEEERKVGDRWFDSDGKEWEMKSYGRVSVSKLASRGIADQCNSCESFIIKPWDKDVYRADGRCYHCQLNYELDLKFDRPIRWFAYRRLKDLKNMISIEQDMEKWIDEKEKLSQDNPFDKKIANAISNENLEMTINKNKSMS